MNNIKIKILSDTHRSHTEYTKKVTDCDLIIHCGDAGCYDEQTYETFKRWAIAVAKKTTFGMIFIPGNHDQYIAENLEYVKEDFIGTNVCILINEGIEIGSLKIWGSPCSATYGDTFTSFTAGENYLAKIWSKIPDGLDILITHSPPQGFLDRWLGSPSLSQRILSVKPKLHAFGHIHEERGIERSEDTVFVNASAVGSFDTGPFDPIEIEFCDGKINLKVFCN